MIFDKLSLFADGLTVGTTANANTYSRVLDLRRCGQAGIDGMLRVWGGVVGTANATGSVTTVLQTSADGAAWTDVASQAQNGATLVAMFLPCLGLKRFVRLKFAVGGTALGSAVRVKAGLVDQFDMADAAPAPADPFTDDLAADGDALAAPLALAASSGTITKGTSGTVAVTSGKVTAIEAPSDKYTVTVSGSTVTIALAADAADGTVYLVGGDGAKVGYAVTAAAAAG